MLMSDCLQEKEHQSHVPTKQALGAPRALDSLAVNRVTSTYQTRFQALQDLARKARLSCNNTGRAIALAERLRAQVPQGTLRVTNILFIRQVMLITTFDLKSRGIAY